VPKLLCRSAPTALSWKRFLSRRRLSASPRSVTKRRSSADARRPLSATDADHLRFPHRYESAQGTRSRSGAFATTLVAFFLAEIGDKTQIATVGLAARFDLFYAVVAGTTLGMMLANIPVVIAGDRIAGKLPLKAIRMTAAVVFAALGIITLLG